MSKPIETYKLLINGTPFEIEMTEDKSQMCGNPYADPYSASINDKNGFDWKPYKDPKNVPSEFKWVGEKEPKELNESGPNLHCQIVLFKGEHKEVIKDYGKKVGLSRGKFSSFDNKNKMRITRGEYIVGKINDHISFKYTKGKLFINKINTWFFLD